MDLWLDSNSVFGKIFSGLRVTKYLSLFIILLLVACQSFSIHASPTLPGSITATRLPSVSPLPSEPTPVPSSTLLATRTPRPTLIANPTVTLTAALFGILGFPPNINPLTGLVVSDPALLIRRPVMVKVSNYPRSGRPHAGLSKADIVFEYYIGEEANRFLAIYYGQNAPRVGPMRSGRLVDAQLVNMYQGILAYGNADPQVDDTLMRDLGKRAISFDESPCPPVCGKDTHSVAGVFVDTGEMTRFADKLGINNIRPDLDGMIFDPIIPPNQEYAMRIGIQYSKRDRGEWRYDPQTGLYRRWIEADDSTRMIPLVDRNTDDQIVFANIVIIFATYHEFAPTLHQIEVWDNDQGKPAIFFRDGIAVEGSWRVPAHIRPMQFYNSEGLPMSLKPGNTWIVIAGDHSSLEQPETGRWETTFRLP